MKRQSSGIGVSLHYILLGCSCLPWCEMCGEVARRLDARTRGRTAEVSNRKDTCDWSTTATADEAHVTVTRLRVLSLSLAARRGVRKEVEKRVAHRAFDHWTNLKRHGKRAPKPACHDARRPHSSSADPQIHIATAHCAHIDAGLPALQHLDGIRYSFACCSPRDRETAATEA